MSFGEEMTWVVWEQESSEGPHAEPEYGVAMLFYRLGVQWIGVTPRNGAGKWESLDAALAEVGEVRPDLGADLPEWVAMSVSRRRLPRKEVQ